MPRFAANLSTMFTDRPFLERFAAARRAGFEAVECQFPYEEHAADIKAEIGANGLRMLLINTPPGDFAAGERGLAGIPGREGDFRAALDQALAYAEVLNCPLIHIMAGVAPEGVSRDACLATFKSNLQLAGEAAAAAGRLALLEPINTRDIPGFIMNTPAQGAAIIAELGMSSVRLQFDFYHAQIMSGDLAKSFERHLPLVAHVQIAGVPERQEPDIGEISYPYLFEFMDRLGYQGWVGCEYFPAGRTEDGLGWAVRYGIAPEATTLATGGERV